MAALYDLVGMTVSSAPGTGASISLGNAATVNSVTYLTFASAGTPTGTSIAYSILDTGASELGTATYLSSGPLLGTRTPTKSTNANAAINASSAALIFCGPRAEDIISTDLAQTFTAAQKNRVQTNLFQAVTTQTLTSGTGATYTPTSTNVLWLEVYAVGGGGGGGGADGTITNASSAGGATTFNSVVANGGGAVTAGANNNNSPGGAGGTGGTGTATRRMPGQPGEGSSQSASVFNGASGAGGGSIFAGGGAPGVQLGGVSKPGVAGAANTGGGGSGAIVSGGNTTPAPGGGGGESFYLLINSPAASYTYTIGAGGAGGVSTQNGGTGGTGVIFIIEHYV